jgi:uncharacterized protein YqfB (UPF0267 family)
MASEIVLIIALENDMYFCAVDVVTVVMTLKFYKKLCGMLSSQQMDSD